MRPRLNPGWRGSVRGLMWPLMCCGLMAAGCTGEAGKEAVQQPPQPSSSSRATSAQPPAGSQSDKAGASPANLDEVTLQITDYEGLKKLIAAHKGKVVVVDCWATHCEPCMEEFPGLVALHHTHGPDKVACISLSLDFQGGKRRKPQDYEETVLAFLRKERAVFDNVLASEPDSEIYKKMEFGAVPAIFVYDQSGALVERFDEPPVTYQNVGALVATLLGKDS